MKDPRRRGNRALLIAGVFGTTAAWAWASSSQDLTREGLRQSNEGQINLALNTLREAVSVNPLDPSAQTALGLVALQAQRFGEAQSALERAVSLDPRSQTALYSLAMLYEKLQLFVQAQTAWNRFLQLNPSADLADLARRHLERLP